MTPAPSLNAAGNYGCGCHRGTCFHSLSGAAAVFGTHTGWKPHAINATKKKPTHTYPAGLHSWTLFHECGWHLSSPWDVRHLLCPVTTLNDLRPLFWLVVIVGEFCWQEIVTLCLVGKQTNKSTAWSVRAQHFILSYSQALLSFFKSVLLHFSH